MFSPTFIVFFIIGFMISNKLFEDKDKPEKQETIQIPAIPKKKNIIIRFIEFSIKSVVLAIIALIGLAIIVEILGMVFT